MIDRKGNRVVFLMSILMSIITGCQEPAQDGPFAISKGTMGCVLERLTEEVYDEYQFQGVSQDGQWVSISWSNGEDEEGRPIRGAYSLNLISGEKEVYQNPLNNSSSFSGDGSLLIGAHYIEDGTTDIIEYNRETGTVTSIAPDSTWDFLPSYSPDGVYILFNSYRSGNSELYLYDRITSSMRQLTYNDVYDANGEFSSDGSKVVFNRMIGQREGGGYDMDVYVLDLAGEERLLIDMETNEASYPSWAPDNETLVFSSDFEANPEQHNLYIRHPSGGVAKLTEGNWKDSYAYWARDGSYIYFNSDREGYTDVYRIAMDGTQCVQM